tara:strand:- start:987 stop:1271 length:285 start_codon:yes stop_codon:yes gene_type:complete
MDTTDVNQLHLELVELNGRMQRVVDIIENVKERQEGMAEDIGKIKGAVYNPDEGIYARLRELESWKKNSSKILWMVVTSMVGLGTAIFYNTFAN